ncbi:DUF624 domain-containing protein [Paenibacillus sp. CC-CFT747]|nr:DUF624 domain-containing protein [Paenibacillus sp. CC-CFT747]
MEFRGIMGGFYRISEWIMRLSVINVLWVVCSLPFFFLLASALLNPEITASTDLVLQSLILIAIVAPFTLVPASAAMFTVARKWTTGEEDAPLFKTFFKGYKENYLQSMLGGLVYLAIGGILVVNYRFYGTQGGTLGLVSILFIVLFVLLIASFFNFLSITVHFHMKFFQIIKNSLLITIGNPVNSLFILLSNGLILYFSTRFTFLIPFFMGSLMAVVSFWYFHRSFVRMQEKMEKMELAKAEAEAQKGKTAASRKDWRNAP